MYAGTHAVEINAKVKKNCVNDDRSWTKEEGGNKGMRLDCGICLKAELASIHEHRKVVIISDAYCDRVPTNKRRESPPTTYWQHIRATLPPYTPERAGEFTRLAAKSASLFQHKQGNIGGVVQQPKIQC